MLLALSINTTLCGLKPTGLLEEENDIEVGRGTDGLERGQSLFAKGKGDTCAQNGPAREPTGEITASQGPHKPPTLDLKKLGL